MVAAPRGRTHALSSTPHSTFAPLPNGAGLPTQTPLSDEILRCWSLPEAPRHRLTVDDLLLTQSRLGRRVGMILDLSNHDCLYTGDLPPKAAAAALALLTNGEPAAGGGHERRSSSGRSSSGGGGGAGSPSPSPPCSGVRAAPEFQELQYQHIKLVAKELPAPEFVSEVCRVADAFWAEQPTQYIAIHCAYGERPASAPRPARQVACRQRGTLLDE